MRLLHLSDRARLLSSSETATASAGTATTTGVTKSSFNRPHMSCSPLSRVFVGCNVLLALYNFMCFMAPPRAFRPEPCIVVLNSSGLQAAARRGLIRLTDVAAIWRNGVRSKVNHTRLGEETSPQSAAPNQVEPKLTTNQSGNASFFGPDLHNSTSHLQRRSYGVEKRGQYVVLVNYVRATYDNDGNNPKLVGNDTTSSEEHARVRFEETVTYCTQATHDFLFPHVTELCERWQGPLSIAVYTPGTDITIVHNKLAYLLQCVPCVRSNVTFHLVYHSEHAPLSVPDDPEHLLRELGSTMATCDEGGMGAEDINDYRTQMNLTYPINVLRNVARINAQTRYVLASDVELYPSAGIIQRFAAMIRFEKQKIKETQLATATFSQTRSNRNSTATSAVHGNKTKRFVYTLPIFEVEKGLKVPRTKHELRKLYDQKKAIFFHRYVCDQCQNFPQRDRWLSYDAYNRSHLTSAIESVTNFTRTASNNEMIHPLSVFVTTRRQKDRASWEPIYIGTNDEPLYAEELTWEGKRDKMSQMYELCLMDYEFRVLNDVFLCHAPGIKRLSKKELTWRSPFVKQNNARYGAILARIRARHKNSPVRPRTCL